MDQICCGGLFLILGLAAILSALNPKMSATYRLIALAGGLGILGLTIMGMLFVMVRLTN